MILRITSVIANPTIGSARSNPSATPSALTTTPSETKPSTRAWFPSAISAGLASLRPARSRTCAAISFPRKPIKPGDPLGPKRSQQEGDTDRDRRRGVAEVVDEVGEQGDGPGDDEDRQLCERREPQDAETERDRAEAGVRAHDRTVDEPVRVPVSSIMVVGVVIVAVPVVMVAIV